MVICRAAGNEIEQITQASIAFKFLITRLAFRLFLKTANGPVFMKAFEHVE
jgi:hypothetical protein